MSPDQDPGRRLVLWPSTQRLRGRVVLALQVALVAGTAVPYILAQYGSWFEQLIASPCRSLLSPSNVVCRTAVQHPSLRTWVLVLPLLAMAVLAVFLIAVAARWCLTPIRQAVEPLAAVGPQNLGYRIASTGPGLTNGTGPSTTGLSTTGPSTPGRSTTGRSTTGLGADPDLDTLAFAVDTMMDRVAAGYEGQRRFAANASHELRTPLSVQRALIEVGFAQDVTPDQLRLLSRQLLAANERNERLIEGLLVLAETDQGLESRTPQRLDEIAAEVIAVHAHTAATAGVELVAQLSPVTVRGERVLLERLITNLLQNGIKYNHTGGQVIVHVAAPASGPAELVVWNNGDPVPGEAVSGLFEPFRRLRGERIDHSGGAGLGLTIARSIVAAHDGWITATANDSGGGLTVRIQFPAYS